MSPGLISPAGGWTARNQLCEILTLDELHHQRVDRSFLFQTFTS
jgi:hypothetical protein